MSASAWNGALDRRPYRTARIADALREAIGTGELEPGDRLVEKWIAVRFGTSRAPVRDAIRELGHEGLVELVPYRSAVVLGVSEEEVHEVLIPIRLALERYAFSRTLTRIGKDGLAALEDTLSWMETAAAAGDLGAVVEADIRFHETILELSDSPHTVQVWRSISPRIRMYFLRYDRDRDLLAVVKEHRELYDAFRVADCDALIALLETHIAVPMLGGEPRAATSAAAAAG